MALNTSEMLFMDLTLQLWERHVVYTCNDEKFETYKVHLADCLFFFFFAFFWAKSAACGGFQAWGVYGFTASRISHSHSHALSEPHLRPTPQFTVTLDP